MILTKTSQQLSSTMQAPWFPSTSRHIVHVSQQDSSIPQLVNPLRVGLQRWAAVKGAISPFSTTYDQLKDHSSATWRHSFLFIQLISSTILIICTLSKCVVGFPLRRGRKMSRHSFNLSLYSLPMGGFSFLNCPFRYLL
jgi:hypothetical protein